MFIRTKPHSKVILKYVCRKFIFVSRFIYYNYLYYKAFRLCYKGWVWKKNINNYLLFIIATWPTQTNNFRKRKRTLTKQIIPSLFLIPISPLSLTCFLPLHICHVLSLNLQFLCCFLVSTVSSSSAFLFLLF